MTICVTKIVHIKQIYVKYGSLTLMTKNIIK